MHVYSQLNELVLVNRPALCGYPRSIGRALSMPFASTDYWWRIQITESALSQITEENKKAIGEFLDGFWEPQDTMHNGKHWFQKERDNSDSGIQHTNRVSDMGNTPILTLVAYATVYRCSLSYSSSCNCRCI